jgi:hypothetical protein
MNEQVDYQVKTANSGTKFLWWCAGADADILKYSSYSDHVKFAGIGGVVLATGFLAALSMGFAMHTIFSDENGEGNWFVTIPISLAWALIVFNLDRFIVSSTGKGDGESSISGKEFLNALPRLLMAVLLGLTISAPLETVIFKTEIEREWEDVKDKLAIAKLSETKRELESSNSEGNAKTEMDRLFEIQQIKETNFLNAQQALIDNNCSNPDNCTAKNHQSLIRALKLAKEEKLKSDIEFKNASEQFNIAQKSNEELLKNKVDSIKNQQAGFLDRLLMLENLSDRGKEIYEIDPITKKENGQVTEIIGSAFWPIWLVRLLFMIVEIAPVILKLMLIKGPYDYMSENVNQILETKQGISIYHMKDEHSQLHKLKRNHNPERIIAIIEHQNEKETENAKEAITAFAEIEKEQIRNNPDDFIRPIT